MRSVAIALLFAVIALAFAFSLSGTRFDSRFGISWMQAAVLAMLSVPAALIGSWLVAASVLAVGLLLMVILALLDGRDRRKEARDGVCDPNGSTG
jgi:hypothetical protein